MAGEGEPSLIVPIGADISDFARSAEVVKKELQAVAAKSNVTFGQMRQEAENAAERIADKQKAIIATVRSGAEKNAGEMERLFRRANLLLAVNGAVAGIQAVRSVTLLLGGDFEKAYESAERLPMGLGQLATVIKEIGYEWAGVNEEIRKSQQLFEEMKVSNDSIGATGRVQSETEAMISAAMADAESDPMKRADILVREAERKAKEIQRKNVSDGVDPAVAAKNYQTRFESERKRIVDAAFAEQRRRDDEDAGRKGRIMQSIIDDRERREKEADETRRREFVDRINNETDMLRKQADTLRDELSGVSGVRGSDFVQSNSTALGSFTSGQNGASMIVARNVQRQVELQAQIKAIAEKIEANTKAKGGWN